MPKNVVAWFDTLEEAEVAVRELSKKGFSTQEVRIFSGTGNYGMLNALDAMDVPVDHARTYAEFVERGGSLVIVSTSEERAALANHILYGGEGGSVEVVKEELSVGTQTVDVGGVRVHEYATESPITESVELTSETVQVNRHTVDRPTIPNDEKLFKEETFEWVETAEIPIVSKEARIVEEVVVGKVKQSRVETVTETVRETHVDIERIKPAEDFEPAHRFGSELNLDEEWTEIEPQARADWERQHPGTWDRFRDTVRSSWERNRANRERVV